ncbi:hypothetical protein EJ07DRAFT_178927 [Lizonia empirigonia]|nr:hypothetical protein EJ07DRAFT_178927 [Lizonia empirigonia]
MLQNSPRFSRKARDSWTAPVVPQSSDSFRRRQPGDLKHFRFLDLPKELRLMIYEQLGVRTKHCTYTTRISYLRGLPGSKAPIDYTMVVKSLPGVSILSACSLIYKEAEPILARQLRMLLDQPPKLIVEACHAKHFFCSNLSPLLPLTGYQQTLLYEPFLQYHKFLNRADLYYYRHRLPPSLRRHDFHWPQLRDPNIANFMTKAARQMGTYNHIPMRPDTFSESKYQPRHPHVIEVGISNSHSYPPSMAIPDFEHIARLLRLASCLRKTYIFIAPIEHLYPDMKEMVLDMISYGYNVPETYVSALGTGSFGLLRGIPVSDEYWVASWAEGIAFAGEDQSSDDVSEDSEALDESDTPTTRSTPDMIGGAFPSEAANANPVVVRRGAQPKQLQTASTRTIVPATAKTVPRYAQSTQSASSKTKSPFARCATVCGSQKSHQTRPDDAAAKISSLNRQRQSVVTAAPTRKSMNSTSEARSSAAPKDECSELQTGGDCLDMANIVGPATTLRTFSQMISGSKIPVARMTPHKLSSSNIVTVQPRSILKPRSSLASAKRNVCRGKPTITESRPTRPTTPAFSGSKTVRFSNEPVIQRVFDIEEPPALSSARYDGEWLPLVRTRNKPWGTYGGSSVARGGEGMFLAVSAMRRTWILQSNFLSRFKSVQRYEQRREVCAPEISVPQREYGSATYKVLLHPMRAIRNKDIGVQIRRQMNPKLLTSINVVTSRLLFLFGSFEDVEQATFKTANIPKTFASAYARPAHWPICKSEKRLEQWVKSTWPRKPKGQYWDDTMET